MIHNLDNIMAKDNLGLNYSDKMPMVGQPQMKLLANIENSPELKFGPLQHVGPGYPNILDDALT